jgi:hypothetical protein
LGSFRKKDPCINVVQNATHILGIRRAHSTEFT